MFRIKNGLKQGDAISPLFFNFALDFAIRRVLGTPGYLEIERFTSASSLCLWC
jgi:hypothetical protein